MNLISGKSEFKKKLNLKKIFFIKNFMPRYSILIKKIFIFSIFQYNLYYKLNILLTSEFY